MSRTFNACHWSPPSRLRGSTRDTDNSSKRATHTADAAVAFSHRRRSSCHAALRSKVQLFQWMAAQWIYVFDYILRFICMTECIQDVRWMVFQYSCHRNRLGDVNVYVICRLLICFTKMWNHVNDWFSDILTCSLERQCDVFSVICHTKRYFFPPTYRPHMIMNPSWFCEYRKPKVWFPRLVSSWASLSFWIWGV